jgi:CBS domain containing-hemolysin-like protein
VLSQGLDLVAEAGGLLFFLLMLACVSACEQVFLVLTDAQVRRIKEDGRGRRDRVLNYVRNPQRTVITSILASGVFTAGAILCLLFLVVGDRGLASRDLFGPGLLGGLFLAILARALPRALVVSNPEAYAVALAPIFTVIETLFRPITGAVRRLMEKISPDANEELVAAEETRAVTEENDTPPRLEEEKRELIHTIFEFGGTTAKEVMVPRIDMIVAGSDATRREVLSLVSQHGHSRIPIYDDSIDKIIGAVHVKQLIQNGNITGDDASIKDYIRPVVFVPESKKIDELLREFQERKTHLAIVVDEYGGTAGMVTMEDVLEEIVGEIEDEYDTAEKLVEPLGDGVYRVAGKMDLDDLNEELKIQLPTENSDTLGGFVFEIAGKVPSPGEVVESHGFRFVIDRVHRQRIVRVRIQRLEEARVRDGKGGGGFW